MSTVSRDRSRETATLLDGCCNNNQIMVRLPPFDMTVYVSVLQDIVIMSQVRVLRSFVGCNAASVS